MAFADLKNDFVFRRIFATHPDILRSLLNDLLERTEEELSSKGDHQPARQFLNRHARPLNIDEPDGQRQQAADAKGQQWVINPHRNNLRKHG